MRSQTGGAMSFGWGIIHGRSSKQRLNTKSSTESELVGLSEYLPYNIWLVNFLQAQGYPIKSNILYQDNESAIRMAKNGRNSCTGNSRHVHIRYFFVKDRVDKGEVSIHYTSTHSMLADYFTKSLQGKSFHQYKEVLMGWKHINTLKSSSTSSFKERVENITQNSKKLHSQNPDNISKIVKSEIVRPKSDEYECGTNTTSTPPQRSVTWTDIVSSSNK